MDSKKVVIKDQQILYKGWSTLTRYTLQYRFEDGESAELNREIYNSGDGAAVLLYSENSKKVLLVRQFRLAAWVNGHPDGFLVESCAGMLDEKSPEQAVIKEIEEETGYQVNSLRKIGEVYATPGAHMEKIHLYLAPFDESMKVGPGGGHREENEEIELIFYSYSECIEAVQSGFIHDAKTLILLQHAIISGIIKP